MTAPESATVYEVRCAHGVLCSNHFDRLGAESWIAGVLVHNNRRLDCAPHEITERTGVAS